MNVAPIWMRLWASASLEVIKMILIAGAVVGLPLMVLVVLTQAAVAGSLNFAPKAMSFKGNRMDPLKGLARMVSIKALVELGKASLKVVLLFGVATGILYVQAPKILQLPFRSLGEAVATAGSYVSIGSWRAIADAGGDCPS